MNNNGVGFFMLLVLVGFGAIFLSLVSVKQTVRPIETQSVSIDERTFTKKVVDNIEELISIPFNIFE